MDNGVLNKDAQEDGVVSPQGFSGEVEAKGLTAGVRQMLGESHMASQMSGSTAERQQHQLMNKEDLLDTNRDRYRDFEIPGLNAYNDKAQMENPFAPRLEIKGDIAWLVSQYGYPRDYIVQSLMNNDNNHCTATYYLLEQDHKRIMGQIN